MSISLTSFEKDCSYFILNVAKFNSQQTLPSPVPGPSYRGICHQWEQLNKAYATLGSHDLNDQELNSYSIAAAKANKFFSKYPPSFQQKENVATLVERAQWEHVICFYDDKTDALTGCFGNFHICPNKIEFGGKHYSNSEAIFQAQKFKNNPAVFNQFNESTDGDSAISLGRSPLAPSKISEWDAQKIDVMMNALRAKFGQNPALKEMLLATKDAYLLEHLPTPRRDNYWSDGYNGAGGNHLGICLMKLRAEYGGRGVVNRPAHDNIRFEKYYNKTS